MKKQPDAPPESDKTIEEIIPDPNFINHEARKEGVRPPGMGGLHGFKK